MRILHILPTLIVSGAENMAASLMLGLAKTHEVAAVSVHSASNSVIEETLTRAGIPIWFLGKRDGFNPRMYGALDRVFRSVRPHVVHSHLSVLRYALPGLLRRRIPVCVHTVHNLAEREVEARGRLVHRLAFRANVLPVAISEEVERSIKRLYGRDARALIPNGIPLADYRFDGEARRHWRAQEGFAEDALLYLSVGRLMRQKNPQMLLDAFASLADRRTHLLFAGLGDMRSQLESRARAAQVQDRVHFLGERNDIAQSMAAADVFTLSSDWEGNPLSVMEAMASGLPVIATSVGGVPELVGRDGILVSPGDCIQFAAAMRRLLEHPELRTALGSAARVRAHRRFGAEHMVEAYERLYQTELDRYRARKNPYWTPAAEAASEARENETVAPR